MTAIIKLRLLGLKDDYKVMLVMALLALGMVYAFSGSGTSVTESKLFLAFDTRSEMSEDLVKALSSTGDYQAMLVDEASGRALINDNEGVVLLVFGPDFENGIKAGAVSIDIVSNKADVEILGLKQAVSTILSDMHGDWTFSQSLAEYSDTYQNEADRNARVDAVFKRIQNARDAESAFGVIETAPPGTVDAEVTTMENFLGFALLFSAYSIVFGIGEIVNDKMYHTWARQLQSPIGKVSIIAGNLVTTVLIGFIQMAIIFLGGNVMFGIGVGGHWLAVLTICFAYIFSLTGMGLLLSSMVKNHGQLSAATPVILTSFAMLGGCMWPLEIVSSRILLGLSLLTPHRWALEALHSVVIEPAGKGDFIQPVVILMAMGIVYVAAGIRKLD